MIAILTLLIGVAMGYANGRKDADDINDGIDDATPIMAAIVDRGLIGALGLFCLWPIAGVLSLPVMALVSSAAYAVSHRVTVSAYADGLPVLRLDLCHPYDAAWIAAFGGRAALAATSAEVLVAILGAWWLA